MLWLVGTYLALTSWGVNRLVYGMILVPEIVRGEVYDVWCSSIEGSASSQSLTTSWLNDHCLQPYLVMGGHGWASIRCVVAWSLKGSWFFYIRIVIIASKFTSCLHWWKTGGGRGERKGKMTLLICSNHLQVQWQFAVYHELLFCGCRFSCPTVGIGCTGDACVT